MTEANILIEDIASTDASKTLKRVSISGQLDESNVDEKSQAIYQLITQVPKGLYLIFDFEKLEYMNSKSIGYMTDWYGKISGTGGQIVIVKAKPNIVDILQVIGLTQLIPMYGSIDEAKFAILNAAAQSAQTPAPAPALAPTPVLVTVPAPTPVASQAPAQSPTPAPQPAPVSTSTIPPASAQVPTISTISPATPTTQIQPPSAPQP
jgi:anti-anti-sigma factor